ncbi:unnamed protein product [Zymoseptoria tritici ST99CH_1E4]|uniref:Uncharacterized protein n=1 Tax=Zymoseptoria tritici ST99CH_1E4 TaxID=1276532 RepID=A0A2H1HBS7_ZYMTR|nr:unnamed protein product [Zymoseptoria tritici ST99CH_1E4]
MLDFMLTFGLVDGQAWYNRPTLLHFRSSMREVRRDGHEMVHVLWFGAGGEERGGLGMDIACHKCTTESRPFWCVTAVVSELEVTPSSIQDKLQVELNRIIHEREALVKASWRGEALIEKLGADKTILQTSLDCTVSQAQIEIARLQKDHATIRHQRSCRLGWRNSTLWPWPASPHQP